VIFGGVGQTPQVQAIRNGTDILVCTPGRLIDLMQQGYINLQHVECFVLDEADRMLDMGFIHDIRRIIPKLPAKRQNLMFSATMPREIADLAHTILKHPVKVEVTPVSSTADKIEQSVYFVEKKNKPVLLAHLLDNNAITRALVFTRTKHGADRVVRQLDRYGIRAEAIHGNKSQNARQRALGNFKSGKTMVLIASDIAARGLDVDEISHIVNFDLPNEPETYVHRIGRTARAGASGVAVSFCDSEERSYLNAIQRLIKKEIPVRKDHPTYPARSVADELVQKSGGHGHANTHAHASRPAPQHSNGKPRHHAPRPQHSQHTPASGSRPQHSSGGRPQQAPARHPNSHRGSAGGHPLGRRSGGGVKRFGHGGRSR
jgi:ATP-dependent RNA helicase RhlE